MWTVAVHCSVDSGVYASVSLIQVEGEIVTIHDRVHGYLCMNLPLPFPPLPSPALSECAGLYPVFQQPEKHPGIDFNLTDIYPIINGIM